jgi:hypothetical protein
MSRNMVIKQGWLKKSPTKRDGQQPMGNRKRRWFVLRRANLEYWTDPTKTKLKGTLELLATTDVRLSGPSSPLSLVLSNGCVAFSPAFPLALNMCAFPLAPSCGCDAHGWERR